MIGAKHLYLIDFDGTNLPNLKETIEKKYPDVKVRITAPSLGHIVKNVLQATVQQADAADEDAIKSVCEQALKEEGRLDVFFANVGLTL